MADTPAHILILDDDTDVACAAQLLLRRRFGQAQTLTSPRAWRRLLAAACPTWCCWT
jgi:DNA-binding NtrC family response regulator